MNGWMVFEWLVYDWITIRPFTPQTQMQTETEGYRMPYITYQ